MIKTAIKIIFAFHLVLLFPCLLQDKSEASTEIQEYIIERINNIRLDPLSYAEGLGYDSQVLLDTQPFLDKFIGKDAKLLKADEFLVLRADAQNSLDIFEKINSEKLRILFEEAYLCFKHGLYIATVIMCRKVLEESLTEKGGNPRNLKNMINNMHGNNEITKNQCDIAHTIREFGNDGAHYRKEFVTEVKGYDALQFLEYYFTAEHQREHVLKTKQGS